MRRLSLLVVAAALLSLAPTATWAQNNTRSWLSNAGDDSNNCLVSTPCATFTRAQTQTMAGGTVGCLTPMNAGIGSALFTKTITLDCEGLQIKSGTGSNAVTAGPNDVVTLRGINFGGAGSLGGLTFTAGGGLVIENCTFHDWSGTNGLAINFQPSTVATLTITNSQFVGNGNASSGGAIRLATSSGGFVRAHLRGVTITNNYVGIAAIGNGSNVSVEIQDSTISHNRSVGVVAVGAGAVITLAGSSVVGNAGAATSGNVLSYQNNVIRGNNPDTFPPSAGGLR